MYRYSVMVRITNFDNTEALVSYEVEMPVKMHHKDAMSHVTYGLSRMPMKGEVVYFKYEGKV